MPSGSARFPPPTRTGVRKSWHSSTSPAAIAWPASSAPPTADPLRLSLSRRTRRGRSRARSASSRSTRLEGPRVHDLVGRPPDCAKSPPPTAHRPASGLPEDHRLVHPAPVEVGADRPLEVVDEGVHLLVGRGPVEVAVVVRDVAVERRDRRVDQLAIHSLSVVMAHEIRLEQLDGNEDRRAAHCRAQEPRRPFVGVAAELTSR